MKLHAASKQEIKRVGIGSMLCLAAMLGIFFLLSQMGFAQFDYTVLLGGILGTLAAIANFAALCITIQNAAQIEDKKRMQTRLQLSYNGRLILQGAWVLAAIVIPWVNVVAAAVPLLFPSLVIFFLRFKGSYRG